MTATDPTIAEMYAAAQRFRRVAVEIDTNGSGAFDGSTEEDLAGLLISVYLDFGDLTSGVDLAITELDTGAELLTLTDISSDARWMPRVPTHDHAGVATGGLGAPPVVGPARVVVAQGGASKSGTLYLYIDGTATL